MRCNCPYIICQFHGDCVKCIEHNRLTGDLAHCMEKTAIERGAVMPFRLPREVFLEDSFEAMSQRSADLVAQAVQAKPDALLCLPAGSTAIRTYEILKEMQERGEIDFSQTSFVALDEWLDLEDESENCDGFMRKYFYGQKTADIARDLEMKENTVYKHIERGLSKLRKILEKGERNVG